MSDDETRNFRSRLDALNRALDTPATEADLGNLFPVIVLQSYFQYGNWPGPYKMLNNSHLALTWVVSRPEQTMVYVNTLRAGLWETAGVDWQARALQNVRKASTPILWTHEKRDGAGKLIMAMMMHPDGFGPSRLLLEDELAQTFPEGYRAAIPERSCGIVFPADISQENRLMIEGLVANLFREGATPMRPEIYTPEQLRTRE